MKTKKIVIIVRVVKFIIATAFAGLTNAAGTAILNHLEQQEIKSHIDYTDEELLKKIEQIVKKQKNQ